MTLLRARVALFALICATFALCGAGVPDIGVIPTPTKNATVTMMTGAGTTGGASILEGCGLGTKPQVKVCLSPCLTSGDHWDSLNVAVNQATYTPTVCPTLGAVTLAVGAKNAGNYDVEVDNLSGAPGKVVSALYHVNSALTPVQIFSAAIPAEYVCDDALTNAFGVDEVPDRTGNGHHLVQSNTADEPALTLGDPTFNHHASCNWTLGSTQYLENNGTAISLSGATGVYVYAAFKMGGAVSGHAQNLFYAFDNTSNIHQGSYPSSGNFFSSAFTNPAVTVNDVISTNGQGTNLLTGMTTTQVAISTQNVAATTTSSSRTLPTSFVANGGFVVGNNTNVNYASALSLAEIGILTVAPTPTQATELVQYLNERYQTYAAPHITAVTNIGTTTGAFRFSATNLLPGFVGTLTYAGTTTTLSCIQVTMQEGECTGAPVMPVGATNLFTVTNPDTNQTSWNTIPVVPVSNDPVASEGLNCIAYYQDQAINSSGSHTISNGDSLEDLVDKALNGNDVTQATVGNMPVATVGDADFGGHLSWTGNGTTTAMNKTSARMGPSSPTSLTIAAACKAATSSGSQAVALAQSSTGTGNQEFLFFTSGTASYNISGGANATWGSATSTAVHGYVGRDTGSLLGLNVDDGTEVTNTGTSSWSGATGGTISLFQRSNSTFFNGKCAAVAIFTDTPNAYNVCKWLSNAAGTSSANCP